MFSACLWLSCHCEHPRLFSSVVAGWSKLDRVEGWWTDPGRGLHRSRTVRLQRPGCSQHQLPRHLHCPHHHPADRGWRWVTHVESAHYDWAHFPGSITSSNNVFCCYEACVSHSLSAVCLLFYTIVIQCDKETWGNSEMNYPMSTHPIHITRQECCGRETSKTRRVGDPGTGVKNTTPDYSLLNCLLNLGFSASFLADHHSLTECVSL